MQFAKALLSILVILGIAILAPAAAHASDLCTGYGNCNVAPYSNHGYNDTTNQTSVWGADPGHNCTNYVAFVESTLYSVPSPGNGLGNANTWGTRAPAHGATVNSTPTVGSVAWWDENAGVGSDGHVAIVESVGNGTVTVSEDSFGGDFDWRTYSVSVITGFIHFAGGQFPGGGGNPPPVVGVSALSYTGATVGSFGHSVVLSGRLVDASTSSGLGGRPVAFVLGSQSCSGTTDGAGDASCSVTLSQAPGGYTVSASFGGDSTYASSGDSKPFTIQRVATKLSYSGPGSSEYYEPFTAMASLTDVDGGGPVSGETVVFSLGASDGCSAVTDGSGTAACSITPTQAAGDYSIVASFAGDAFYLGSGDTEPFEITRAETTTTLTAVPGGSSKFGQLVTFTAVSASKFPGAPAPTGSTVFGVDGVTVGASMLDAGAASTATSSLSAGAHAIGAAYGGDHNFLPSSGDLPYFVTCDVNISGSWQGSVIVTTTTCLAPGAHVAGPVIVKPGGALDVESAKIGGALDASAGAGVIRVCDSSIAGAVDAKNLTGLALIGDPGDASCAPNTIGGALDVKDNTAGVEAINNTVGGAIMTDGNSGPGPYPGDTTTISGNHNPPTGLPSVPGPESHPGAPGATGSQAPAQSQPQPPQTTSSTAPAPTTPASGRASTPTATTPHPPPAITGPTHPAPRAKPPTQTQKLAAALHACNRLKPTKRRPCTAAAKKRYPAPGQHLEQDVQTKRMRRT